MSTKKFGESVRRTEDPRLLRGEGGYLDDLDDTGALHVAFLRAESANAGITVADVTEAAGLQGVEAVYVYDDLVGIQQPLPQLSPQEDLKHPRQSFALAKDRVRFVGEPIAMVLARDRYIAEDACGLIDVIYDEMPVAVDLRFAASAEAPRVHDDVPNNLAGRFTQRSGDPDAAFDAADVVIRRTVDIERSAGTPLETRGVLARFDRATGDLNVYDSTQAPAAIRSGLAVLLDMPLSRVRVAAPDVGGGFGTKVMLFYPEELLIPWAAVRHGGTVKWVEDRAEHFVGSYHERRQIHDISLAATRDGVITGLRDHFLHDGGAYMPYGVDVAAVTAGQIAGPYRIPNLEVSFDGIYTNTTPVTPYRGCGRPQACFVLESSIDALAAELGIDRMEIRRRNLISSDEFPYERKDLNFVDGAPLILDSGDYLPMLQKVLDEIDYDGFGQLQKSAQAEGRLLGLGLAIYIEGTGLGPYEGARIEIDPDTGVAQVSSGTASAGQSHLTTLAQIAADGLGMDMSQIAVVTGDTGYFANGGGAFASRSAVTAGNAVAVAATTVRNKALRLAAHVLEADVDDLEIVSGRIAVRGAPDVSISLQEIAAGANPLMYGFRVQTAPDIAHKNRVFEGEVPLPPGEEPGLAADGYYSPPSATWASGVHAAIVEIDPLTWGVHWHRYVCSHDCGTVINPTVVDGQVVGGIAQGIGGSFYERMDYDAETGNLRNGSFMDFLIPYATEVPSIELHHQVTPSPLNPMGIKGVGEAGAIPVPALFASAIRSAFADTVDVDTLPLSPTLLFDMSKQ